MKHFICILCYLFMPLTPCFLFAQQNDQKDLVIEIPLKIDIVYGEIYIDSLKFEKIRLESDWCSFTIIEKPGNIQPSSTKKENNSPPITSPFLSKMKDTLAIIVSDKSEETSYKLIIVLGLNNENELRCFYKTSNEKKYKSFVFYDNEQYVPLKFILKKESRDYVLWNPFFKKKEDKVLGFIKKKETSKFQLILTSGIHTGVSSLKFKPDTSQSINSIYYEAKVISSFNIKFQALYSANNLLLGIYTSYENNNYENNTRIVSKKSGSINPEYTGNGNWPEQLVHFGAIVSYDILISDYIVISPSFNAGIYTYSKKSKPFDATYGKDTMKELKQKYSLGGGIYFKIPLNENLWFTTGYVYQFNHFDARGYFTDINKSTYHSRQEISRIEFGTCLKF